MTGATPPALSRLIEKRLREFISGPADTRQAAARRFGALPVYSDVGGTLLLTPTGQVLLLGEDVDLNVPPEAPPDWCLVAKIAAVEKFPELSLLLPTRPDAAPNCPVCDGTGRLLEMQARCGTCLGLGWVSAV